MSEKASSGFSVITMYNGNIKNVEVFLTREEAKRRLEALQNEYRYLQDPFFDVLLVKIKINRKGYKNE